MGVRQHLTDLESKGLVAQTQEERQTRGRPVHLWKLSKSGHGRFPDSHSQTAIERKLKDPHQLENMGFTRYEKQGSDYVKTAGKGPDQINRD